LIAQRPIQTIWTREARAAKLEEMLYHLRRAGQDITRRRIFFSYEEWKNPSHKCIRVMSLMVRVPQVLLERLLESRLSTYSPGTSPGSVSHSVSTLSTRILFSMMTPSPSRILSRPT